MPRSWDEICLALRKVERQVSRGEYVDTYDAASLSNCFLSDEADFGTRHNPDMNGFTRLVHDITVLLNEALVNQQSLLANLKSECAQCASIATNAAATGKITLGSPVKGGSSGGGGSSTAWDSLPQAEDELNEEENSGSSRLSSRLTRLFGGGGGREEDAKLAAEGIRQRRADVISMQLQRRLQDVHDAALELLDAKLCGYEVIRHCGKIYTALLVQRAVSKGVSRAAARAALVVDLPLASLRAHRFLDAEEANSIVVEAREVWSTTFLGNRKVLAERRLLLSHTSIQRAGEDDARRMKMGAGITLLFWAFSECFNNEQFGRQIWHDPTFAIFVCFGDLLLLLWMWGLSMQIWRASGIDFIRLLRLEDTELASMRAPENCVYSSATNLSIIFLVVFICFNKAVRGVFNHHGSLAVAHSLPTLMVLFFVYRIVNPFKTRSKWLGFLGQVLAAPFYPVVFRDGYVGDLLTSLVRVSIPMCFSLVYLVVTAFSWLTNKLSFAASRSDLWWQDSVVFRLAIVPVLTLMPLWIRLMQCLRRSVESGKRWPHFANALKYTSAIAVISFGTFRPLIRKDPIWVACFVFATLFQYLWDLTMDWGILVYANDPKASNLAFGGFAIRQTRMLGPLWVYVAVMLANLVLRFAWALTLLPANSTPDDQSWYALLLTYLAPLIAAGEVLRRMVWGFFRLEYEQLEVLGTKALTSHAPSSLSSSSPISSSRSSRNPYFDKMSMSNTNEGLGLEDPDAIWDPDGKQDFSSTSLLFPDGNSSSRGRSTSTFTWDTCFELEWFPLPSYLVNFLTSFSLMDVPTASLQAKVRFAESFFFATAVFSLIVIAAAPAIYAEFFPLVV